MSQPYLPPGVPPLLPRLVVVFTEAALVTADAVGLGFAGQQSSQWGLYDSGGNAVIVGDSVLSFDNDSESRVANYPVEGGGFESFNKVAVPYDVGFVFSKSGTVGDRAAFLASLDAAKNSLALLTGVTPEYSYPNLNVVRYTQQRSAQNGVTLLRVTVYCQEIRQAPPISFSNTQNFNGVGGTNTPQTSLNNTQNPESADAVNGGTVQAVAPASQATTPGTSSSPGTIQTPNAALTNSTGNSLPPGISSAAPGSSITYNGDNGPATGVVQSVSMSNVQPGTVAGYNLTDGTHVGVSNVTAITPPGYTTVQ